MYTTGCGTCTKNQKDGLERNCFYTHVLQPREPRGYSTKVKNILCMCALEGVIHRAVIVHILMHFFLLTVHCLLRHLFQNHFQYHYLDRTPIHWRPLIFQDVGVLVKVYCAVCAGQHHDCILHNLVLQCLDYCLLRGHFQCCWDLFCVQCQYWIVWCL